MLDTTTRTYLYSVVNEEQRNILQHNAIRPTVLKQLAEIMENYGLRQRLETASQNNSQVQILEAGSGSGSFLRDFADFLNGQHLLEAANLNGVDLNLEYVIGAEKHNHQKPNWAKINYYQHDITTPLENNYSLKVEKKLEFDCICAMVLAQYVPNARQHILKLYDYLKPGGVFYLCDIRLAYEGEHRCIAPTPLIEEFGRTGTKMVRGLNGGKLVAEEMAGWLREAGAEQIQVVIDDVRTGEDEQRSLEILRYHIAIVRSVTPVLLNAGLIDQTTHDRFLAGVFQIDRTSPAQFPFYHTLARKPAK